MKRFVPLVVLFLSVLMGLCHSAHAVPPLLRRPALSRTQVVFNYAGDLWSVGRSGGEAHRITNGIGIETDPAFSLDGSLIAFNGQYDGNTDVYIMAASGGMPKRLTYHPAPDSVLGWTPDGKRILFTSTREGYSPVPRLFTISKDGGPAEPLPLPMGSEAAYNASGTQPAYVPVVQWEPAWKRYRGGQTSPIWIADLPHRTSRSCRAVTPTTRTRCGSATRSTSFPTGTAPLPSSPTTPARRRFGRS